MNRQTTTRWFVRRTSWGLVVHPYAFREDSMPSVFSSFEETLRRFHFGIGVNGLFNDFTDTAGG